VFKSILKIGHQNVHWTNVLINIRRVHENVNNVQFPKKAEDRSENSSNSTNTLLNCPKSTIQKLPRFAKQFIELSSVRYKPTKTNTKQCINDKTINQRKKCQIPCSQTNFLDDECFKTSYLIEIPISKQKKDIE
jgi:hypothetical protein